MLEMDLAMKPTVICPVKRPVEKHIYLTLLTFSNKITNKNDIFLQLNKYVMKISLSIKNSSTFFKKIVFLFVSWTPKMSRFFPAKKYFFFLSTTFWTNWTRTWFKLKKVFCLVIFGFYFNKKIYHFLSVQPEKYLVTS